MDTNRLKKFAQKARLQLMEGVRQRFLYWGFDKDGNVLEPVEKTSGGYVFRGQVYNDETVYSKWKNLVRAIERHTAEDIIEEAAYTWFNRLLAIRILEKNGYTQPALEFVAADLHEPVILRNVKKGILPTSIPEEVTELKRIISAADENEVFASLLVYHCRNHQLLNTVFGNIDDYTELLIPNSLLNDDNLIEMLNSAVHISDEDYREVELIGWLYQFYISEKKEEVFAGFKKKKKARAEDLPAATQIFTPRWIVKYLVENSAGRIWLDYCPDSSIRGNMQYLVESIDYSPGDPIISEVADLKVLDPAVGSGHFLVVAFDLLMDIYKEEGYSTRKAVKSILTKNLYGLDICPRAAGLAIFALMLKAAQFYQDILMEDTFPHVYAMPEPLDFSKEEVKQYLGPNGDHHIDEVHRAFGLLNNGRDIGSALIITLSDGARECLENVVGSQNRVSKHSPIDRFLRYSQISLLLTDHYPVVLTNPPYMGKGNMNHLLSNYLKEYYPNSKSDLFAVFMEIIPRLTSKNGRFGFITTPSWLFLSTHRHLRTAYLTKYLIESLLHLSRGVFGADFGSVASTVRKSNNCKDKGEYFRLVEKTFQEFKSDHLRDIFLASLKDVYFKYVFSNYSKSARISTESNEAGNRLRYSSVEQSNFLDIPENIIAYWLTEKALALFKKETLGELYSIGSGLSTSDNKRFVRFHWEPSKYNINRNAKSCEDTKDAPEKWYLFQKGGEFRKWYGNLLHVVNWKNDGLEIKEWVTTNPKDPNTTHWSRRIFNTDLYFKPGIIWSTIASGRISFRYAEQGTMISNAAGGIFSSGPADRLSHLISALNSNVWLLLISVINPTINYSSGVIQKTPAPDEDNCHDASNLIQIAKQDWDEQEISCDFQYHPILDCIADNSSMDKSYSALAGLWQDRVMLMQKSEQAFNKDIVEEYSLYDSVENTVPLSDITLCCNPIYRFGHNAESTDLVHSLKRATMIELLSYLVGVVFGRYRLDQPGLNIAHSNLTSDDISPYMYHNHLFEIDTDAIIPMIGSNSQFSDDIVHRIEQLILMIWGEDSYTENLNFLNDALDDKIEKYLTKKFWNDHKKMYKKKPIYWQFASPTGVFKVLTYMHRMDRFTVQKIRQNYLFKYLNHLEGEISNLSTNESSHTAKQAKLLDKLRSDLIECREYGILLKDVADKQIEFDLDDGVTENYKLFEGVVTPI